MNGVRGVAVLVVLAGVLQKGAGAGEDAGAQLRALQEQVSKLAETVAAQQRTIDEQQKQLSTQQRQLQNVSAEPRLPNSAAGELLKRLDLAEKSSVQAVRTANTAAQRSNRIAVGAAVDTSFRYFDGENADAGRPSGSDFSVRTMELSFEAQVDRYFKSYVVLATHQETGHGHGHEGEEEEEDIGELTPHLEEAAIYTTSLDPVTVTGGRFYVPFGRLSNWHTHELPFVTRPGSIDEYVGGESGADGLMVQAELPIGHYLQLSAGAFNKVGHEFADANPAPARRGGAELTYFFKALTRFEFCDEHSMEVGLSTLQVPDHLIRRNLNNLEFTYRWSPEKAPVPDRLVWGTEIMRNEQRSRFVKNEEDVEELGDDPIPGIDSRTGWGGYSYVEYFYNKNWSFGPRVDFFQPVDPEEARESKRTYQQTYSLLATYRFSEFSRLRAEFSRHEFSNGRSANEFLLQWTVLWGAHSHGGQSHGSHSHHGHDHGHDH